MRALLPLTMIGGVLPYYLLAMLLLYVFAFTSRLLPMSGAYDSGMPQRVELAYIGSIARHAVLPALSIILTSLGAWALTMRGLMVNTIGEDYMLLAEAKGLPKRRILWWYAVRNAIPPQLTHLAIALGYVVSGAILVEIVFSYPGLGYQLYRRSSTATTPSSRASPWSWPCRLALCVLDHRPDLSAAGPAGDLRGARVRANEYRNVTGNQRRTTPASTLPRRAAPGGRFLQGEPALHGWGFAAAGAAICSDSSGRSSSTRKGPIWARCR